MLRKFCLLSVLAASLAATSVQADITPAPGYSVSTVLTGHTFTAYDAYESSGSAYVYGWTGGGLKQYSVSSGSQINDLGTPSDGYTNNANVSVQWVEYGVDGSVYVGFYNSGGTDMRIYKVNSSTGTWQNLTSVNSNYSMAYYGTEAFIMAGDSIYLLDTDSGATTLFASVGGYSSQIAFADSGLVFCTSGVSGGDALINFSTAQLDSFLADTSGWSALDLSNADILDGTLDGWGGATTVDADGNIYFTANDYYGDGSTSVEEYAGDSIAEGSGWSSIVMLYAVGEDLYYTLYNQDGISVLTPGVPEPSTYALLGGVAMLLFTLYRRRKVG
ncbi:MAG: PEP-CTERM sorting domain-containing protein [Puniceicoccales bacterium]